MNLRPPEIPAIALALALALVPISSSLAQTTVTTDPVGFTTINCSGSSDTIVSLPLARPTEFVGQIASVSGSTITISGSPAWTASQWVYAQGTQAKTYYVEVGGLLTSLAGTVSTTGTDNVVTGVGTSFTTALSASNGLVVNGSYYIVKAVTSDTSLTTTVATRVAVSGATASLSVSPNEGRIYTVTANDASSLTLNLNGDSIASLQPNTNISIAPYWTINTVFPSSDVGVSFVASPSAGAKKTQILIPDYITQGVNLAPNVIYFYYNNAWRKVGQNVAVDYGDNVLIQNGYFIVKNPLGTSATSICNQGVVHLKKRAIALVTEVATSQDNFISMNRPVDVTLNNSGLFESGAFLPSPSTAVRTDQLYVFDNTQLTFNKSASAIYYYYNGGWRKVGGNVAQDFGTDTIPSGAGVIVRKKSTSDGATKFVATPPNYL